MEMVLSRAPLREPVQGRSRASFERMLAAAEALMIERGSDDFTLSDVGKRGKVSIGSIYCRFDSKDELVRVVQGRVLERVNAEQLALVQQVRDRSSSLTELVDELVHGMADALSGFASVLRPFMARAGSDPVVAAAGKRSYGQVAGAIQDAFLTYAADIRHPDPNRAVASAYGIIYASLARYLGFGSSAEASGEGDWSVLKDDLADMLAAYLTSPPTAAKRRG